MEYIELDRANISNTTEMYAVVDSRTGNLTSREQEIPFFYANTRKDR